MEGEEDWEISCKQISDILGFEKIAIFLKDEESMILQQKRNFIIYTDYFKKIKFLLTSEHFKINKALIKDSSKLDETDCVLCFTAITCLSNPIIYCSKCERGAHRICLQLARVPSEDFFCVSCSEEIRKKHKKKDKDGNISVKHEQQMLNWIRGCRRSKSSKKQSKNKEICEELLVDRMLLVMKNKNFASRTEDINRILSIKLEIKFEGKLFQISDNWVHLEVPVRVINMIITALVKANFRESKDKPKKLILDLQKQQLFMKKSEKLSFNEVILNPNKNYNLEEWVLSSQYCISGKDMINQVKNGMIGNKLITSKNGMNNFMAVQNQGVIHINENEEVNRNLELEKQQNIIEVIQKGESHLVKNTQNALKIFRCENIMILKKILEDDKNFKHCIQENEEWMQKINLEISNEIKRIVQVFRDCKINCTFFKNDYLNSKSLIKDPTFAFSEKQMILQKSNDYSNNNQKKINEQNSTIITEKFPIFEKPKNLKSSKSINETGKTMNLKSNEYVIQRIKMSKIVSLEGHILDDIRFYESLMLFGEDEEAEVSLRLQRILREEVSLNVHRNILYNESFRQTSTPGSISPFGAFDLSQETIKNTVPMIKIKMKNKPLDSKPFIDNQHFKIEKRQKKDYCFYCNKNDLMLINFGEKKVHLFCLIVSGNLLDFFKRPQCRFSIFLIFLKLVKFNIFNYLIKKDWKQKFNEFLKNNKILKINKNKISFELKKILLENKDLRNEMIEIGNIVFKKKIQGIFCQLCSEKIGI